MGLFNKNIKMVCPNCKNEWLIKKATYMTTPYIQRASSPLFCCSKCGSQGEKK